MDPLHVLRLTKENACRTRRTARRTENGEGVREGGGPRGTAGEGSSAASRQQPANEVAQFGQGREQEGPTLFAVCSACQKWHAAGLPSGRSQRPPSGYGCKSSNAGFAPTVSRRSASISCMKPKALDGIAAMRTSSGPDSTEPTSTGINAALSRSQCQH